MAEVMLVSLFWLLVLLSPTTILIALGFLGAGLFTRPKVIYGTLDKLDQDYYVAPEINGATRPGQTQWVVVRKSMLTYLLYERIPLSGTFILMRGMLCAINDGDYTEYDRQEVRHHLYRLNNNCHWLFMFSLASLLTAAAGLDLGVNFRLPGPMTDLITMFWPVSFLATAVATGLMIWLRVRLLTWKVEQTITRLDGNEETDEKSSRWAPLAERTAEKLRLDELLDFLTRLRQYLLEEVNKTWKAFLEAAGPRLKKVLRTIAPGRFDSKS